MIRTAAIPTKITAAMAGKINTEISVSNAIIPVYNKKRLRLYCMS